MFQMGVVCFDAYAYKEWNDETDHLRATQLAEDSMNKENFYTDVFENSPWGDNAVTGRKLNRKLIEAVRTNHASDIDDLEAASALLRFVWDELQKYGTDSGQTLQNDEIAELQRSLQAVLNRLGITFSFPWRDFEGFKTYWIKEGASGSWQARREILTNLLMPVLDELEAMEYQQSRSDLAQAISPLKTLGWREVDEEIHELRKRFSTASSRQDYRDVGNRCVAVLEALSRTVYNPEKHVREGEEILPAEKSKLRLERVVEDSLGGKENEKLRGLSKKVIELAHSVKHSPAPSRRSAGICADSVILLANILRRVDEEI